ncbi:MAG: hypothetical protein ACREUZ_09590, partial [Burkholderiales bacterium]
MGFEQADRLRGVVEIYALHAEHDPEEWGALDPRGYLSIQCWWKKAGEPVDEGEPLADISDWVQV